MKPAFFLYMIYLLLSILSSLGIMVVFKLSGRSKVPVLGMVFVNYLVATVVSCFLFNDTGKVTIQVEQIGFWITGIGIGLSFFLMFLFIEKSVSSIGISLVASATKMSVVLPVVVSIYIDPFDLIPFKKLMGLLIMLIALLFLMFAKSFKISKGSFFLLPILFLAMGSIDSLVKIAQQWYVNLGSEQFFSFLVFLSSAFFALSLILIQRKSNQLFRVKSWLFGLALGLFNFGSLYFILKTLNLNSDKAIFFDSSRIFMFNNIGIVLTSVFVGVIAFQEKISVYNYFGILLSVIGFYLLI